MKSYKFRIYPTHKQTTILNDTLVHCQRLYNVALEHRREVYRISNKSISRIEQYNELPELKEQFPEYAKIYSQVLQNTLNRVDCAFKNFFRRVKFSKERAGFPRYKSKDRYNSFCYPQTGFRITGKRIDLSKIGFIKVNFHRQIPKEYNIKTCTIKYEIGKWYVIFVCSVPAVPVIKKVVTNAIGIDLGLTDFAVLSNGTEIMNPKYLKKSEERLKALQSQSAKRKSKSIKRQFRALHYKIANQRKDFQHKLSYALVKTFDLIAYEDLKVRQMIENSKYNLQKHISDASWSNFIFMLKYKAENAGTYCIAVNPKGTTQKCSNCDTIVPKDLFVRLHKCTFCGFETTRDHNAALNIHKLGINLVDNFNHPKLI